MSRSPTAPSGRTAFTVVELLLVIVVVAILVALVTPNVLRHERERRPETARAQLDTLGAGLEAYRRDVGQYPTTVQGLAALWQQPTAEPRPTMWRGPYIPKALVRDPWDHPFVYRSPREANPATYDLLSYGADGKPGGVEANADIVRRP